MITNTVRLRDTWGAIKANLKKRFTGLNDNDLAYVLGREEEVLGHIQEKTGISRDELLHILRDECGCNC